MPLEKIAADDVQASIPPRGWNSYDSFSWIISEQEFLQNAEIASQKLLPYGYQYVVVDYLWYRKIEEGSSQNSPGFDVIDEWGRPIPDPARWPSSQGGKGFKEVANRVHKMGLKFGIHVMRGISTQAVNANTPIMGSQGVPYKEGGKIWYAKDIGLTNQTCSWMPACFMSVQTNLGAGRAFLKSLYTQYAEWGVDFVKHDCIFGENINIEEIKTVSEILKEFDHPIVYSLSPGKDATPQMAMQINSFVNMYRITNDDWDNWSDVQFHFNVSRDFADSSLIGADGLRGKSWPDLDMLPLGWLTDPGVKEGPHRFSNLTLDEQKTQLTLWGMTKSPLMFGGDLRKLQYETMNLITNPTLLTINSYSTNNKEVSHSIAYKKRAYVGPNLIRSFRNDGRKMASNIILSVSSCKTNTKNWEFDFNKEEMNLLCWKGQLSRDNDASKVCFYHTPTIDQNGLNIKHQEQYRISTSLMEENCLDSSPKQLSTLRNIQSYHFSPCLQHPNQKWKLREDGSLYNDYTRLCANLAQVKDKIEGDEVRIWAASGKKGENYVAIFNLARVSSLISIPVKDVIKAFRKNDMYSTTSFEHKFSSNCMYNEVWSGQKLEVKDKLITTRVPSHGVALISQTCN